MNPEKRDRVYDSVFIDIKTCRYEADADRVTVGEVVEVLNSDKLFPKDSWVGFNIKKSYLPPSFGAEGHDIYILQLKVKRLREETDEEYSERMRIKQVDIDKKEEKEKLEYFRLKAKYGN